MHKKRLFDIGERGLKDNVKTLLTVVFISTLFFGLIGFVSAADPELTNYKSGINVNWSGTKGTDYCEEYFYHDKLVKDAKVVYLRNTTNISMEHNERNTAFYSGTHGGLQIVGIDGRDDIAESGDEGIIRYKIDRERQDYFRWTNDSYNNYFTNNRILPAYTTPFNLSSQFYNDSGVLTPVVGTVGDNGGDMSSKSSYYHRGMNDSFGDEWHILTYADDDHLFLTSGTYATDVKFRASDARTVLLVVDPRTPCLTARATGGAQFYTTPPKAYWSPKLVNQTTYFISNDTSNFTIELRDIYGNNIRYRINGGSFNSTSSSSVFLTQNQFNNGTNTLEYYYGTNTNNIKTRIIVKNPGFPSRDENHGYYLWVDEEGYQTALSRITREPYKSTYDNFRTRADFSGSQQDLADENYHRGYRSSLGDSSRNAFVALVNGFNYTLSGKNKSFGRYAVEMVIENSRTLDPVGFEIQMSGDASGNRELHAFGYYEGATVADTLFGYDLIVANFTSDKVSGGLTPVEDFMVRDTLAGFAYEALQWSGEVTGITDPGMWGGARMMVSTSIAIILHNYSTPYYGTSGFGYNQTTYPLAPYQNDQLTWKQALFDCNVTKTAYPDFTWCTGLSDNGAFSLYLNEGQTIGAYTYGYGDWLTKGGYYDYGHMGQHIMTWANMVRLWANNYSDARLEAAINKSTNGTLRTAGDNDFVQRRFATILLFNERWPNAVANARSWVQSLSSSDGNSDNQGVNDAGILAFAWYDDGYVFEPLVSTLVAPEDDASIKTNLTSFNATFVSNSSLINATLSNVTLYVWNSTGHEMNTTFTIKTGNVNSSNISFILPYEGVYRWNYLVRNNVSTPTANFSWGISNFTLVYDLYAPRSNLIYPSNGSTVNSGSTINFNATFIDNSGLSNATLYVWDAEGELINLDSLSQELPHYSISGLESNLSTAVSFEEPGVYTWNYEVYDYSGNSSFNSTNFTFTYADIVSPQIDILYPQNITYTDYPVNNILFNISSNEFLGACTVSLTNWAHNHTLTINSSLRGASYTNSTLLDNDSYTALFACNDTSGNLNMTQNITFFIHKILPTNKTQFGAITLNNYTSGTYLGHISISPINISHSFVLSSNVYSLNSGATSVAGGQNTLATVELVNETFLNISRTNPSSSGNSTFTVNWIVISDDRANVQRGNVVAGTTSTRFYINLSTPITTSQSFVTVSARSSATFSTSLHASHWAAQIINSTQIMIWRNSTGTSDVVHWQVVDWRGATVQSGVTRANESGINASITSVNTSNSFLYFNYALNYTFGISNSTVMGTMNSSEVKFTIGGPTDQTRLPTVSYFVVSHPSFVVQNGSFAHNFNTQYTQNLSSSINRSRSFGLVSASTSHSAEIPQRGWIAINISNSSNVVFTRGLGGTSVTNNVSWFIIGVQDDINISSQGSTDSTSPTVTLLAPINGTNITSATTSFNATMTDNVNLSNATLYVWNSTGIVNQTTYVRIGTSNFTNTTFSFPRNGSYIWNYFVVDNSSNSAWATANFTINYTVILDSTQPLVQIVYPGNTTYNTNVSAINYTASDSNLAYCWYSNETTNFTQTSCGTNFTNVITREGSNTVRVYANDSSGNINSSSVTFFKDTVHPQFTNYTSNSGTLTSSGTGTFNVSVTNSNGTVLMQINSVNYSASNLTATNYNVSVSLSSAGSYTYYWYSFSNSSLRNFNSSTAQTYTVNSASTDSGSSGSGGGGGGGGGGGASTTTTSSNSTNTTSSGSGSSNAGTENENMNNEENIEFGETGKSTSFWSKLKSIARNEWTYIGLVAVVVGVLGGLVLYRRILHNHRVNRAIHKIHNMHHK